MSMIEKAAARLGNPDKASLVEKAAAKINEPAATPQERAPAAGGAGVNAGGETAPAPGQQRKSRRVEIDFDRLAAMGMLTPHTRKSRIAEEFRIIKRPLLQKAFAKGAAANHNGHLIMVTSSRPDEGKTFMAINLAMSIASERDLTVLLVDADFSSPGVLPTLALEAERGLINVLADDDVGLADVLIRTNLPNLSILPPGPPNPLSTELLASDRMGRLVEDIAARYPDRVIIFDAPPVLASSEPGVLAMHVGQVLFVVESERTSEATVREALGMISSCKNIGLVLNRTRSRLGSEQFGSYYGYGGS